MMTPQAKFDYLAGMVALIQNHRDRIATADRMAMFLADNCPGFDAERFQQRVQMFYEAFAAERERHALRRIDDPNATAKANAKAAALRDRLQTMFNEIRGRAYR